MRRDNTAVKTITQYIRPWLYATGLTDKTLCLKIEMRTDRNHAEKLRGICGSLKEDVSYIGGCEVDLDFVRRLHSPRAVSAVVNVYADSFARLNYFLSTHEYVDFALAARRTCRAGSGTYTIMLHTLG